MAAKKPFRTILSPPYPPDHFTVEEAREAVIAVMLERGELSPEEAESLRRSGEHAGRPGERRPRSEAA